MSKFAYFNKIKEIHHSMINNKSKRIFQAQLQFDIQPDFNQLLKILKEENLSNECLKSLKPISEKIKGKKVYLYGAGEMCTYFLSLIKYADENADIQAVFDKNYINKKTVIGFPVIQPPTEKWIADNEDYIICISSIGYICEIAGYLEGIGVPQDKIIVNILAMMYFDEDAHKIEQGLTEKQYFDYMVYFKGDGAFIDAGCYNGDTSVRFADKCNNNYSKIFAFEPEKNNLELCKNNKEFMALKNVELMNAGVGKCKDTLYFEDGRGSDSRISETGNIVIDIVTIDETVKDEKVSFIKMDIEGAELENTIKRDKPLCAICVYHRLGDIIDISSYLKHIVPQYKFALGHYSFGVIETVLYAFVD